MNFNQNGIDLFYDNFEQKINTKINMYSGKCLEDDGITIVNPSTCNDSFLYELLNYDEKVFETLQNKLYDISKELSVDRISFSSFLRLHYEKIIINDSIVDYRKFGSLKLLLKDHFGDTYLKDIPLLSEGILLYSEKEMLLQYKSIIEVIRRKKLKKGNYKWNETPVIFSPQATGYFIHEVLGHLLEEDVYEFSENFFKNNIFSEKISIMDDVTGFENIVGLNKYDDCGDIIKPILLVDKGKICNIISIKKDRASYGMARRMNYAKKVLPRMRCTILKGYDSMDMIEMIHKYKNVIVVDNIYSGSSNYIDGNFSIGGDGYYYRDGEIQFVLNNLIVNGNVIEQLNKIEYVGNDIKVSTTECSKLGHVVRVGLGGPSISFYSASLIGDVYI